MLLDISFYGGEQGSDSGATFFGNNITVSAGDYTNQTVCPQQANTLIIA